MSAVEPAGTASWTPEFEGQRPPFQPGHELTLRHGSYATLALQPRAAELAEAVRATAPLLDAADEAVLGLLGLTLARVQAASEELDRAALADRLRLSQDARGWVGTAARLLDALGCTPTARARLGLDLTRAAATRETTLARLDEDGRRLRLRAERGTEGEPS